MKLRQTILGRVRKTVSLACIGTGIILFLPLFLAYPLAALETNSSTNSSPTPTRATDAFPSPTQDVDPEGGPKKPTSSLERTVLLQVFLDNSGFAPGIIGSQTSDFTVKAIKRYEEAHGLEPDGDPQSIPFSGTGNAFTHYTISSADMARIGAAPKEPKAQARLKWLPYASLLELLGEKFHTTPGFLRKLNPQLHDHSLRPGDQIKVPNVKPFDIAEVEAKRTDKEPGEAKENLSGPWVDVDVRQKELEVREENRILASFPITPGSTTLPAPQGHWHVNSITFMPIFRYDKEMLYHGRRGSQGIVTPPGPNSMVGVVWIGLNKKGIGIHGTDEPETIGRTTSHGCIRLSNWDAARVAGVIQPGAKVIIH